MEEQKIRNGIDVAAMRDSIAEIGSMPEAVHAPKTARVQWLSGMQFKASVRQHTFMVDEPRRLAGEDTTPNARESVRGACGACLATGFVFNATRRGLTVHSLEVEVASSQDNAFTFLGLDSEGHSGFDKITAKLYVQADADEATIREVWDHTVKTSPVGNSLTRNVTITPDVEIIP